MLSRALDIKRKHPKRSQFRPLSLTLQLSYRRLTAIQLNLTTGFLVVSDSVLACFDLEPSHSSKSFIDHESQSIRDVRFEGLTREVDIRHSHFFFEEVPQGCDDMWSDRMYLEIQHLIFPLFRGVPSDIDPMNGLKKSNSLLVQQLRIEILLLMLGLLNISEQLIDGQSKVIQILRSVDQASREGDVEVRNELVDMDEKGVSLCIDRVDLDDRPKGLLA